MHHQQPWLVDVGFGDLFVQPLALEENRIQSDGRHYFKIEPYSANEYWLLMSANPVDFTRKYAFSTQAHSVSSFVAICAYKQTNPSSYFVQNKVCTKPTAQGRLTLFNQRLIDKSGDQRTESFLKDC